MLNLQRWQTIAVIAFTALALLFALPNVLPASLLDHLPGWYQQSRINLGLDLRGGAHFLLEADLRSVLTERLTNLIDSVRGELRKQQVGFKDGTIEPTFVRQGDDRILLQVPGIKDNTDLKRKINQTAKLTFHLINEDVAASGQSAPATLPPTTTLVPTREGMQQLRATSPKAWDEIQNANPKLSPEQICRRYQPQCLPVFKRVVVGGEDLDDAKATFEQQQGGRPIISFAFNGAGGRAFCAATRANIGKRLAIQLDNEIISAPVVQSAICGGSGIITGSFTTQQTQEQALLLRSGALPATLSIIEERTVGADLGADAIHSGTIAAMVGTALVILFMLAVYGPLFGGFASLAMMVNMLLVFAGMSILGASLTLPGIAGLVLTVGMSVDSNVLIYERVPEEKENGRSPFSALATGYERALTAVIDRNLTALLGALVFGLNFGIDFEGGIAVQVRAKEGTIHLDELRSTLGNLGLGEVSLQEFGDASTALIRVQRQEGNAQCVANAERVMKRRAGDGWSVKPGPANTGDVEFAA